MVFIEPTWFDLDQMVLFEPTWFDFAHDFLMSLPSCDVTDAAWNDVI